MNDVIELHAAHRLVPVVVVDRADRAPPLAEALAGGGLPSAEVTLRTPAALSAISAMAAHPGFLVGAGTVVRPEQVEQAVAAGARYIVSPGYSAAVDRECRQLDVLLVPGVATATELQTALDAGRERRQVLPGGRRRRPGDGRRALRAVPVSPVRAHGRHRCRPTSPTTCASRRPRRRRDVAGAARRRRRRRLRAGRPRDPRGDRARGGAAMTLELRAAEECAYDAVSLGEVMLRLDPGEGRIRTAREFKVWEGGGEYNVARGLSRCFGLRTAVVTSLVDNEVGHLVEGLVLAGGVDPRFITWIPDDGIGRDARNGLNFTERGFGVRGAKGVSDRGRSAASQMRPGDTDWEHLFGTLGVRWFHTGGIYAGLSSGTADVVIAAMEAARRHGTVVSYDLNYRPSLWGSVGGPARARQVNAGIAGLVDVLIGNEEDFTAALGYDVRGPRRT